MRIFCFRNSHITNANVSLPNASKRKGSTERNNFDNDPTQLLPTLRHTELMGVVSVLYGLLIQGAPERPTMLRSASNGNDSAQNNSDETKSISEYTLSVALAVLKVLNAAAEMDLKLIQVSIMVYFPVLHQYKISQ